MTSLPRPLFKTFKRLGRSWFKRTRPEHIQTKPHFEFTVASYNVLADQLLHEHPDLYFNNHNNHERWIFDWNYRKNNLIEEILYANVDVSFEVLFYRNLCQIEFYMVCSLSELLIL